MSDTMRLSTATLFCLLIVHHCTAQLQDCPHGCECLPSVLRCENAGWHDIDRLKDVKYRQNIANPTPLETLVITGSSLEDLAGAEMLDETTAYNVNELDLSDNFVTSIDAVTLRHFVRLQMINLSSNAIESFGQSANHFLFARMPLLREIHMNEAFSMELDSVVLADMLRSLFDPKNGQFIDLGTLSLENNHIQKLHRETFCHLESLKKLSLKGNQLTAFPIAKDCSPGPRIIDMSDNLVRNVDAGDIGLWRKNLLHLQSINLAGNKFHCTCKSEAFLQYLHENADYILHELQTICVTASPTRFAGMSVIDVTVQDLTCDDGGVFHEQSSSGSSTLFILTIIALSALIVYVLYTRRDYLRRKMTGARTGAGAAAGEFGVINGYRKLIGDDEHVQPEFV